MWADLVPGTLASAKRPWRRNDTEKAPDVLDVERASRVLCAGNATGAYELRRQTTGNFATKQWRQYQSTNDILKLNLNIFTVFLSGLMIFKHKKNHPHITNYLTTCPITQNTLNHRCKLKSLFKRNGMATKTKYQFGARLHWGMVAKPFANCSVRLCRNCFAELTWLAWLSIVFHFVWPTFSEWTFASLNRMNQFQSMMASRLWPSTTFYTLFFNSLLANMQSTLSIYSDFQLRSYLLSLIWFFSVFSILHLSKNVLTSKQKKSENKYRKMSWRWASGVKGMLLMCPMIMCSFALDVHFSTICRFFQIDLWLCVDHFVAFSAN